MKRYRLGDVIDVKRGTSVSSDYYAEKGELIRLTLGNFNYPNGGFKANTSKKDIYYIGKVKENFILKRGDIITPLTEQTPGLLGETAIIPEDNIYIQTGDIGLILPNTNLVDKSYIYYLISSNIVKKQLGSAAQQTKIRHTSPEKIKDCIVMLPSLDEQKRVANLLTLIDRKIENNKKITHLLEEQTQTLYDYWFTQFDFPNKNGKPYRSSGGKMIYNIQLKSEIPNGWEVVKLSTIINVLSGYAFSSTSYTKNGKYDLYTIKNVQDDGISTIVDNHIDIIPNKMPDYCFLEDGDILTSLTGNVGRIGVVYSNNALLNQRVAKLQPSDDLLYGFVLYTLKSKRVRKILEIFANGSSQSNLSPIDIENIVIPFNKELAQKFSTKIHASIKKYIINMKEIEKLYKLRDLLLPMLINGQVKIAD